MRSTSAARLPGLSNTMVLLVPAASTPPTEVDATLTAPVDGYRIVTGAPPFTVIWPARSPRSGFWKYTVTVYRPPPPPAMPVNTSAPPFGAPSAYTPAAPDAPP